MNSNEAETAVKTKPLNPYEQAIVSLTRAEKRLSILPILLEERNYMDVVRETHGIVQFTLEGILYFSGQTPNGNLGRQLKTSVPRLPKLVRKHMARIDKISSVVDRRQKKVARNSRPTKSEADETMKWGRFMVRIAQEVIKDIED